MLEEVRFQFIVLRADWFLNSSRPLPDQHDPVDLKRVLGEDEYVARFFRHVQEKGGDQVEIASKMIIGTLKWRKETGIGHIAEGELDPDLRDRCVLYSHGRDVDGKKLLIFNVSRHSKGKNPEENKKMFMYYIERLERYVGVKSHWRSFCDDLCWPHSSSIFQGGERWKGLLVLRLQRRWTLQPGHRVYAVPDQHHGAIHSRQTQLHPGFQHALGSKW